MDVIDSFNDVYEIYLKSVSYVSESETGISGFIDYDNTFFSDYDGEIFIDYTN